MRAQLDHFITEHRKNTNGNGSGRIVPRSVDLPRVERAVREILLAIGEDPDREGLVDTPQRVVRAYREMFAGLHEDAGAHLARQFDHEPGGDDEVVMLRNIQFTSMCEHHLLPFTGRAHVAYLPAHSKVSRRVRLDARPLGLKHTTAESSTARRLDSRSAILVGRFPSRRVPRAWTVWPP